jgi:uncharacterized protein with von Willebrand factor type A (vWA) domain
MSTDIDRRATLERHFNLTKILANAKQIIDEVFLPESSPLQRRVELNERLKDFPADAKATISFMVWLDEIRRGQKSDPEKFERFCKMIGHLFDFHRMDMVMAFINVEKKVETLGKDVKKVGK